MNVIIREYHEDDYDYVNQLLYKGFGYHKEKIADERVYEFVGCLDDRIIGYFNLMEEIDIIRNIKIFHIGYVCVDLEYRGNGYGRKMMEYAIGYAKEKGAKRLELTSGNQRKAAHQLYLSLGFEKRDTSVFRKELV